MNAVARWFMCDRKRNHPRLAAAEREAARLTRKFGRRYVAYDCPNCGGVHVGRAG